MNVKKISIAAILVALVASFFIFDLGQYLSLEYFQSQKAELLAYTEANPFEAASLYLIIYITVTALSLPAAVVVTLAGGALFGLAFGTVLASFASTIGATIAFLFARTLLRDSVEQKFGDGLAAINKGLEKEGWVYLFGLRLVPLFPFFMINLLMGLTKMKTWQYFIVSQLGMLPGTIVFVNAGTQLAQLDSLSGILSPSLIISFALLGIFPFIATRVLGAVRARKVYAPFEKPKSFDRNVIAIGAGAGGLVTSYIAAATKAKVTLIEKHRMGGDCLNTGCVPSKALIKSASFANSLERGQEFGVENVQGEVNFKAVMQRIQDVIKTIEPHDSVERYTGLGVDCIEGEAKILDPYRVEVNGQVLTTKNIVVATGARPRIPPIPGLEHCQYYHSDTIWGIEEQPKKFLVVGGGPIGCELAQSFKRLGSEVTIISRGEHLLPKEDIDVAEIVERKFEAEGIHLLLGADPKQILPVNEEGFNVVKVETGGKTKDIAFDAILFAIGRQANVKGFGLEELGVELSPDGTLEVNEYLQTKYPNIFACGDVSGPFQLTHAAAHQAWYASVNALFGAFKKFKADYRVIPWTTFTSPEVARVGISETEAQAAGIDYDVTRYGIDDLDRAIADGEAHGMVKVITAKGKDKILGAVIVGVHAGDLLAEFVLAMKHGLGLNKILGTIHAYPTMAEANKYAAGEWKRANVPAWVDKWMPKFHAWMRNES